MSATQYFKSAVATFLFWALFIIAMLPLLSHAHHAVPVGFHPDKRIFIRGKVSKFFLRNPHSFMFVEVVGNDGLPIEYKVEFGAAKKVKEVTGWTRTSFKRGDIVEVSGYPSRNGFKLFGGILSRKGENIVMLSVEEIKAVKQDADAYRKFHIDMLKRDTNIIYRDDEYEK